VVSIFLFHSTFVFQYYCVRSQFVTAEIRGESLESIVQVKSLNDLNLTFSRISKLRFEPWKIDSCGMSVALDIKLKLKLKSWKGKDCVVSLKLEHFVLSAFGSPFNLLLLSG
jgi:hypothetical protein